MYTSILKAMRSPMDDSQFTLFYHVSLMENWSENIFYMCTPIIAIESRNRFGKQWLKRKKSTSIDLGNYLFVNSSSLSSHSRKGWKDHWCRLTDTKSLCGCCRIWGVQSLGRGINISIMDDEVKWQKEIILHQKSFSLIAPPHLSRTGPKSVPSTGKKSPVSDYLIFQVWRSMGIWRAGSPTRDLRVWPEPRTVCSQPLIHLLTHRTSRVTQNGRNIHIWVVLLAEFSVGVPTLGQGIQSPSRSLHLVGERKTHKPLQHPIKLPDPDVTLSRRPVKILSQ